MTHDRRRPIEFGRAYANLRRHFYGRRAAHHIPDVTRFERATLGDWGNP